MIKEEKLISKFKRLLRRLGMPRWLHRFGPKKYELAQHLLVLVLRQECRLGYRLITRLLRSLGIKCACSSAFWYAQDRLPPSLWQRILAATAPSNCHILAIDGTGMSRTLPGPYYYWRIDKPYPVEIPLKLSIIVDTKTKKIVALRLRAKRAHDIRDAKYLLKRSPQANWLVADKGYDANWLHQYCDRLGMAAVIPMRRRGRCRNKNHTLRRENQKFLYHKMYYRREIVESVFKAIKTKFGASIASHKISAQRAEAYFRAIAHNIILKIQEILNALL
ncbi:transposase [Candidatus Woesearchaeota archaeon]|nr:transposase [Candidatus Woesearchaeota archaeon]